MTAVKKSSSKNWMTTAANEAQFSTLDKDHVRSLSGVKMQSKFSPRGNRAQSLGATELNLVAGGLIPENSFFDRP
jgi:hypothetical protein